MTNLYLPQRRGFMTIESAFQDNIAAVLMDLNSLGQSGVWGSVSTQKTYNLKFLLLLMSSSYTVLGHVHIDIFPLFLS